MKADEYFEVLEQLIIVCMLVWFAIFQVLSKSEYMHEDRTLKLDTQLEFEIWSN